MEFQDIDFHSKVLAQYFPIFENKYSDDKKLKYMAFFFFLVGFSCVEKIVTYDYTVSDLTYIQGSWK